MAEPQPPQVREGADFEEEAPAAQGSADARKAAAALSSLDARGDEDESGGRKANLDQEALGKAMSRLEVNSKKPEEKGEKGKVADLAERKVAVKVDQADVALLVEELELSKGKATELLKAQGGDAVQALKAYVSASA